MLDAGEISERDIVLEVGPGLGTLTELLCAQAQKVIAVELDDRLAVDLSYAAKTKKEFHNLEVIHQSILDFDTSELPKNYKLIANIPYYLTSNLIRHMLENQNPPAVMVLLIQKEVAQRVAAQPGAMSILSVAVQFYAEATLKQAVPAKLFTPPPKVDSQIIQIKRRQQPLFPDIESKEFFKLVRAGFSEKRKKLRSSLSGGLQLEKVVIDELLKTADISADARAQELTMNEWHKLYQTLHKN